jgi:capsular polysaccharide export protein
MSVTERVDFGMVATIESRSQHFLFLQGLPGPFFKMLGAELARHGAVVSRVNFNGGDVLDWPTTPGYWFRKHPERWPVWLRRLLVSKQVTDIILFGDCRLLHVAARQIASVLGISVHVFEEGYLRPNHVTLELSGVNGNSALPVALADYRALAEFINTPSIEKSIKSSFGRRSREALLYYTATVLLRPLFRHFQSHRHLSIRQECLGWTKRFLARRKELSASNSALAKLGDRPFMLLPLQLEGDAQISHHSSFPTMATALISVIQSFATCAPASLMLLIKRHPFDPDIMNWRRFIEEEARRRGVSERVFYTERADLDGLLGRASGVVTVNSTVGPIALSRGVPVLALGDAIYRLSGLTSGVVLDEFWLSPGSVNQDDFNMFCRVLKHVSLLNGGFHDRGALRLLITNARDRLLEPKKVASLVS